jgi:Ca2+-binding RTX toxin-like protein
VSTIIFPITPISIDGNVKGKAGDVVKATSGETIAVTDPASKGSNAVVIEAPDSGIIEIASGTVDANVIITGSGTAAVAIGTGTSGGDAVSAAGSTFQVEDSYQGNVLVNLNGAIISGGSVDTTTETPGGGTIADNLGTVPNGGIDFYINTGSANDQVQGSAGNDFIRLGAGDDLFNAGAGDDIIRMGTGNDSGTLGAGNDIVYLTVDQLQGVNAKTITDFDVNSDDKIQIDADLKGLVEIKDVGSNSIVISLTGAQTGETVIVSEGNSIDEDDIEFV